MSWRLPDLRTTGANGANQGPGPGEYEVAVADVGPAFTMGQKLGQDRDEGGPASPAPGGCCRALSI